ncbi:MULTISPECIES: YebC/PmpR family DNA-binding transcriptional regulator [unclassified Siphonobacter]|uniref:YebC/PmpR family DNA-binding transcriptional regulator n=1 Tax=unclassified Siphonobacter TaxID=2635712 RepID=UPI000CC2EBFB|nr:MULTISPECIES: YebC/PmpR family DNA-binding transcriptional regulator [unclassified Siphonobacter]MDQ1089464.1 YebC/PmpR family DNA-binding regulatory protein [Siphonobacter sp. SORGH_AS_1065]MDR6195703.1 YebC/PmpR family DNA-binding regulatory protein [Siphonobacter sp. SORGH_AS_0500]PKK37553.1 YebC/PmpR family DNA-binding transcriptional regulator [Siphonobacter sp. SORGH_AS_0500]
MGRAFEFRKARKFKRWGQMAKTFTRIGKDITLAVKSGGSDPTANSRLRAMIQNAKAANMPKENVDRAIKRATAKDQEDYKEVVYEGYGPHGVAVLVECTTDNTNRTVANVRSYFNKLGGSMGTSGMLDFIFDRKSVFKIANKPGLDIEELELELIDFGAEELFLDQETDQVIIYGEFTAFGGLQKYLEENGYEIQGAEFERIPNDSKELSEEEALEVEKLIERLEEDDDVQNVYHNMK